MDNFHFHAVCLSGACGLPPEDIHSHVISSVYLIGRTEAIACMTFPSNLRPFSFLSRIKAITVLKRDKAKEIRPRLLACHGVVLNGYTTVPGIYVTLENCTHQAKRM